MAASSRLFLVALLLAAGLFARPASAAESYDNCTDFIDSLPATISTQGTWCLRKNLSTNITIGNAIEIAANNVTIDCNDFKIGGLAAGDAAETRGIYAENRQNATVRHCNLRGFGYGIQLSGGAGHLVEDNRLDNNLYKGMHITGDNNRVRHNAVYDTGGFPGTYSSYGIFAAADVIDNTVSGVFATATNTTPYGIYFIGAGNVARDNRVRGLQVSGSGSAYGISALGAGTTIDGNQIVVPAGTSGTGVEGSTTSACSNNVIAGFDTAMANCTNAGGNTSL